MAPVPLILTNSGVNTKTSKSALRTRIILLSIGLGISFLSGMLYLFSRISKRRAARRKLEAETVDQAEPEHGVPTEVGSVEADRMREGKYTGSEGYEATPDQTEGLLSGAQNPARLGWDSESVDVGEVQRPRSVASFTSVPPRYEEYRPQGVC